MPSLPTPPKCCAASVRATLHVAFAQKREARPSGFVLSRPYGFTALRPGDSLAILFRWLRQWASEWEVSFPPCHSSYGAWTFTPVGLAPTDHASLRWTHRFRGLIRRDPDPMRLKIKWMSALDAIIETTGQRCTKRLGLMAPNLVTPTSTDYERSVSPPPIDNLYEGGSRSYSHSIGLRK